MSGQQNHGGMVKPETPTDSRRFLCVGALKGFYGYLVGQKEKAHTGQIWGI